MLPTIRPGDTLLIDNVGGDEIFEGDVVLFAHQRRLVAHRVMMKSEATGTPMVQTQGDAVGQPDRPVAVCAVMGRVSYIVRGGKLLKSRKTLHPSERVVAALLRRSSVGARIIERGLAMRHVTQDRAVPCQP
jgi:signal peptidase I